MNPILKRAVTLGAGLAMKRAVNYPFDFLLYPVMLLWLGYAWGGLVMTVLSVFLNLLVIMAYDWSATDWFLIEELKGFRENQPEGKWKRLVAKFLRKGDVAAFFILCLDDPITVTLYLRHGAHQYNGMRRRDWGIFLAATVVANMYWIFGWTVALELLDRLFA